MHVHDEVLNAANRIGGNRGDWTFTPDEVVKALPDRNQHTVRTHIGSRCCVNAPVNHPHKWDYFRRLERGRYEVLSKYRVMPILSPAQPAESTRSLAANRLEKDSPKQKRLPRRDVIHAVAYPDQDGYYVECLEVSVVTQGDTLEEAHTNVGDAFEAVLELYAEQGRSLPASISLPAPGEVVWSEALVGSP